MQGQGIGLLIGVTLLLGQMKIGVAQKLLLTLQGPSGATEVYFGTALACLGDVNGDGVPDLAVWEPDEAYINFGTASAGRVMLVSGADGQPLLTIRSPTTQPHTHFGLALAGMSDVNGDDVPDLAIGAPGQAADEDHSATQGQVFLISGAHGKVLRTLEPPLPQADAQFGYALARLGDVNGDGVPDLAVGAPGQQVQVNTFQGQVWLFSGPMASPCGP
jgi:FG-GAP repeat